MSKTTFIKEGPDDRGRIFIIEGEIQPKKVFSIKRFICEVQQQETPEETQALADMLLEKLLAPPA